MEKEKRVLIIEGDITQQEVDVIVNAANTQLLHGGGVAGAIVRRGGESIQKESDKIAPIPLGGVGVTSAGKLPARYIFHAATMHLGGKAEKETIRKNIQNIFQKAEELKVSTLALPALGCGIGGLSLQEGAEIILKEIQEGLKKYAYPKEIRVVLWGKEAYRIFYEKAKELSLIS